MTTRKMIEQARAEGGKVKKAMPKKAARKNLAAAKPDLANQNLVKALEEQVKALAEQNAQLQALVAALSADKPVRFKIHRDMDRESRTYLLMQYMDVVPVTYERKLNS